MPFEWKHKRATLPLQHWNYSIMQPLPCFTERTVCLTRSGFSCWPNFSVTFLEPLPSDVLWHRLHAWVLQFWYAILFFLKKNVKAIHTVDLYRAVLEPRSNHRVQLGWPSSKQSIDWGGQKNVAACNKGDGFCLSLYNCASLETRPSFLRESWRWESLLFISTALSLSKSQWKADVCDQIWKAICVFPT